MRVNVRLSSSGKTRSIIYRISFKTFEVVNPSEAYPSGKKYKQLDYSTGLTVLFKDWDKNKKLTRNDSYKNGQIIDGVARVLEIGSKLSREQNLTFKTLREALDADESLNSIFNKERSIKKDVDYVSPMEFIKSYIDKAQVTAGTKKDYNNTYNHLEEFQIYTGKVLTWKSMGYEFYLDMVEFLKTEKDMKGSTIDKVIKNIKVFLGIADLQDNLQVNQDFKKLVSGKSLFAKVNKEEAEHVYLTEAEIKQITEAEMDECLSGIRDLFIIGCWTGLRISDLKRLGKDNIKDGLLTITTQKTSRSVTIPVTDELQAVLNKYPDRLPKIPTDQHYNREIKKVCEKAKINDLVLAETKKGSMRVTTKIPKYELITSHTARRSFATNLYRRGIPSTQLMMLTGHKTEDSFMKYIKVTAEDNAKDVAKKLRKLG